MYAFRSRQADRAAQAGVQQATALEHRLAIGTGGIAVELFRDIGYLALPATRVQVHALIGRLKLATLLAGFRGRPAADTEALVDAALGLAAQFAQGDARLQEIELNPVFVMPGKGGVLAVDALVKTA